jgi:hypothetical protein
VTAAAEKLIAALPTQLRSFSFATGPPYWTKSIVKYEILGAALLAAAATMRQLTELHISHQTRWDGMQFDPLVALPQLRTLTIAGSLANQNRGLKQLRQLRELTLKCIHWEVLSMLCQPPHALQLETLRIDMGLGAHQMHALVHWPTLTELDSPFINPDAWPLLPQLPHLRRLQIVNANELTEALASSISSSLSLCTALDELTLSVTFALSFWQRLYGGSTVEQEQRGSGRISCAACPTSYGSACARKMHPRSSPCCLNICRGWNDWYWTDGIAALMCSRSWPIRHCNNSN